MLFKVSEKQLILLNLRFDDLTSNYLTSHSLFSLGHIIICKHGREETSSKESSPVIEIIVGVSSTVIKVTEGYFTKRNIQHQASQPTKRRQATP